MDRPQLVRHYGIIWLISGLVFFYNLGVPKLWDRDEPRNAGCAAEMMARGDWVVPVFNGQLRSAKPVLLYWLIMGAYGIVGVNEWGARLPSALLAVGTVLATYHLGRRLFNPTAAIWSAVALATSLLFDVSARAATPDAGLIFFSTLGLAIFARGMFPGTNAGERASSPAGSDTLGSHFAKRTLPWQWTLPLYAALGLGVLTKGPVGLVLPVAVMGLFVLIARLPAEADSEPAATWKGRARRFVLAIAQPLTPRNLWSGARQLRPILGAAVVLAVALPWYIWVGLRTEGAWLEGFLWDNNVRRVIETLEQHQGTVLFYPAAILAGMFPWSAFALPVFLETRARLARIDSRFASYLFCACWVGVYVGLFTLARTKLPSYIAPCYPALALLAGAFFERWLARSLLIATWWPQVALGVLAAFSGLMLVVLPIIARKLLPGDEWLAAVAVIPLVGVIASLVFARQGNPRRAAVVLAATAVLLQAVFFGGVLVRVGRHQQCNALFDKLYQESREPRLATFNCLESSWVVYAGRPIEEFQFDGLPKSPAPPVWPKEAADQRAQSLAEFAAQDEAFVITTERLLTYLWPHLPSDMQVLAEAPYFLEGEKLLLVGRVKSFQPVCRFPP